MRSFLALLIVAGITVFFRKALPHVNQTTVALSFLLAILAVSAVWGMAVSVFMSVIAMLAFNYFFLPPVGALTIADPQNWVALIAFLVTSITGSRLSSRIRREADVANRRRREIEHLYSFSQKLLGEGNVIQLMNAIPNHIVDAFEAELRVFTWPTSRNFTDLVMELCSWKKSSCGWLTSAKSHTSMAGADFAMARCESG